jgi:hypothetical protein
MSARSSHESCQAARELGRRASVAGALLVALVSLLQHAPLWLACLRGAGTLAVLVFATRLGTAALARAIASDHGLARSKKGERP